MSCIDRQLECTDLLLIEHVRENPMLYDPRYTEFRNLEKKEQLWQCIANDLQMSVDAVRRRWTCLRDKYTRELRNTRFDPDRKSKTCQSHEILGEMDFLQTFVRKRRQKRKKREKPVADNLDSTSVISDADHYSWDDDFSEGIAPQKLFHKSPTYDCDKFIKVDTVDARNAYLDQDIKPTSATSSSYSQQQHRQIITPQVQAKAHAEPQHSQFIVQQPIEDADADELFSKSLPVYLRHLSRRHKIQAKVEIYQVLQKYIFKEEEGPVDKKATTD